MTTIKSQLDALYYGSPYVPKEQPAITPDTGEFLSWYLAQGYGNNNNGQYDAFLAATPKTSPYYNGQFASAAEGGQGNPWRPVDRNGGAAMGAGNGGARRNREDSDIPPDRLWLMSSGYADPVANDPREGKGGTMPTEQATTGTYGSRPWRGMTGSFTQAELNRLYEANPRYNGYVQPRRDRTELRAEMPNRQREPFPRFFHDPSKYANQGR